MRHVHTVVIVDGRANDDKIIDNGRRRRHVIDTRAICGNVDQTDLAANTEIPTRCAGCRVERENARVESSFIDASTTRLSSRCAWIKPCGHSPVNQSVAVVPCRIDPRAILPTFHAALWIEGDDLIGRRRKEQRAVHEDRRCLKARTSPIASAIRHIAGMKCPRRPESSNTAAIDVRQG